MLNDTHILQVGFPEDDQAAFLGLIGNDPNFQQPLFSKDSILKSGFYIPSGDGKFDGSKIKWEDKDDITPLFDGDMYKQDKLQDNDQ